MTSVLRIPNGFAPRPYQARFMRRMDEGCKRAVIVWHRRAGKDLTALHQTAKAMLQRRGVYWHVFPTAEQGRKALWEGFTKDGERILEQVFPAAIRKSPKAFSVGGEMVVTLHNGSIWRMLGSDKMDVVGAGPIGVVFSEFSLAKPNTWDLIRPMLRENDGWAVFPFTPRGKNHGHKLLEVAKGDAAWFADVQTLYSTRAYDPEATVREERASGMPEELIQQEYFCDFNAANVGSFWGVALAALEVRGGLGYFDHGTTNVFTSWDLGRSDDTVIWWWRIGPEGLEVLDHYASHGEDIEHYVSILESRARRHGWKYKKHLLPHDAKARTLATRMSVQDQLCRLLSMSMVALTPELSLLDGIQAMRAVLSEAGTRIHPRCSQVEHNRDCDGVEALRAYHREWDAERKCFRETPMHDWASHTADGARYMACMVKVAGLLTAQSRTPEPRRPVPLAESTRMGDLVPYTRPQGRI